MRLTGMRSLRTLWSEYQNLPYSCSCRGFYEKGSKVRKLRTLISMRDSGNFSSGQTVYAGGSNAKTPFF